MSSKAFNITLPQEIVKKVDALAKRNYTSRSDIIRQAVLRQLADEVNEWEAVVDLTKVKRGGVDIDELVKRL